MTYKHVETFSDFNTAITLFLLDVFTRLIDKILTPLPYQILPQY